MLRIESLEIDDHVLEKRESKYHISFAEVEESCLSEKRHIRRGKEERVYKVFSQTAAGRYILVVLVNLGSGNWKVATAKEMTDKERRLYIRAGEGK